jgi:sulfatase maturation enzyme AslB (radical SAM superfamily)
MISADTAEPKTPECEYVASHDRIVLGEHPRPRLLSVCFEPTNQCPGKCPYCLIEEHNPDKPTATLRRVLDVLLDHGTMRFGFGGGEPLLRADVLELGSYVRQRRAGTLLRTSGMFPMVPSEVCAAFDWVDLSFDSVDPDVFRRCRPGVPYEVLVANLLRLVRAAVRVRVSLLITARNLRTVESTVRWLSDTGIQHIRLQRLVRRGQAKVTWRSLAPATEAVSSVVDNMIDLGRELGVDIKELRTISTTTLCIVKSDGKFYSGEPDGIVRRGSVFEPTDLAKIATQLFDAQSRAYSHVR